MIVLSIGRETSFASSVLELVVLLIIFVLVLFASYYVTKWIAKKGMPGNRQSNIEIIESFRLGQSKTIAIIRVGKKYLAVGMTKENMEVLCEVDMEDLELNNAVEQKHGMDVSFKDVMKQVLRGQKGKK